VPAAASRGAFSRRRVRPSQFDRPWRTRTKAASPRRGSLYDDRAALRDVRAFVLGRALLAIVISMAGNDCSGSGRSPHREDRNVGRLVALRGETIVLARAEGETLDIRRADVLGLEVSQRPSRRGRGARLGALVGLGAAVATASRAARTASPLPARPPGGTSPRRSTPTSASVARKQASWAGSSRSRPGLSSGL
jgi:hypothetical protein